MPMRSVPRRVRHFRFIQSGGEAVRIFVSVILHNRSVDRTIVEYYAHKDTNGLTTRLYETKVTDPAGNATHWHFDTANRPVEFRSSDNTVFRLAWQSDTTAQIVAVSRN